MLMRDAEFLSRAAICGSGFFVFLFLILFIFDFFFVAFIKIRAKNAIR